MPTKPAGALMDGGARERHGLIPGDDRLDKILTAAPIVLAKGERARNHAHSRMAAERMAIVKFKGVSKRPVDIGGVNRCRPGAIQGDRTVALRGQLRDMSEDGLDMWQRCTDKLATDLIEQAFLCEFDHIKGKFLVCQRVDPMREPRSYRFHFLCLLICIRETSYPPIAGPRRRAAPSLDEPLF